MRPTALLTLLSLASAACQREADLRPANFDELALATGHWEWQGHTYQIGRRTPATEDYTRQLTFGAGNQLTLRRSGQSDLTTTYQLAVAAGSSACVKTGTPTISFATGENRLGNNERKTYSVAQQQGRQVLTLTGEQVCVDGGATEFYYWVAE